MPFNSLEYLFFFLAVLTVSWLVAGMRRFRSYFLLAASIYFYASNNSWQTFLLMFTATVDYLLCLLMSRTECEVRRRILLLISVVSNLGMLAYFKYAGFLTESAAAVLSQLGFHPDWVDLNIMLPVGISFYTFEALSYTIDVYTRRIPPERDWSRLAFLVTFFPHLIAGPIIRAADFFPQMDHPPRLTRADLNRALHLVATGLIKKLVLADTLAIYADRAFTTGADLGMAEAWLGVYAFAFQIYFDFAGYTDIALGCAKLLGYDLPDNFRRPYGATSISIFWRRWHISLSTWLRDYLYIPLGGSRRGRSWSTYRNLMITMTLGGLWHGAAWHFVLWGFLHGALLSAERAWRKGRTPEPADGGGLLQRLVVFHLVVLLWIPLRAQDLGAAADLLAAMAGMTRESHPTVGMAVAAVIMALAWRWQQGNLHRTVDDWVMAQPLALKAAAYALVSVGVSIVAAGEAQTFIYFRF